MPFFLQSCRYNESINWLFFSDCGIPDHCPENVRIKAIDFKSYCKLVSDRLGITFLPEKAYKLCDIKPALGFIHQDEVEGYDFWAFGDIDVIYGDLRAYFTDERLSKYDLLATHERRISGHLCIMRNNKRMREAFMSAPLWRERISDPAHNAFDEGGFSRLFARHKNLPLFARKFLSRFNRWSRHAEFCEAYSTSFCKIPWIDGSYAFPETWYWKEGHLSHESSFTKEFPYLHFAIWKKSWANLSVTSELSQQPRWKITKAGFLPCD